MLGGLVDQPINIRADFLEAFSDLAYGVGRLRSCIAGVDQSISLNVDFRQSPGGAICVIYLRKTDFIQRMNSVTHRQQTPTAENPHDRHKSRDAKKTAQEFLFDCHAGSHIPSKAFAGYEANSSSHNNAINFMERCIFSSNCRSLLASMLHCLREEAD